MAEKPFPLNHQSVIGIDAQGRPIKADPDFIKLWNASFNRIGRYEALDNVQLEALGTTAQDTADAATAAASNAQTSANAAQSTANSASSAASAAQTTANTANTTANALKLPQFVTLAASADLTNERVLTAGENVSFVDSGAGLALTVSLARDPSLKDTTGNTLVEVADAGMLGFYGVAPVAQPTTSITGATFVANAGTAVNDASTFDGYTIGEVVAALRSVGILA